MAWVLVALIIGLTALCIVPVIFFGNVAMIRAKANEPIIKRRKRSLVPRVHHPEPGVCQCGDALAYHSLAKACSVPGCPCQFFVPSDIDPARLEEVGNGMVSRLALEAVNLRTDMVNKQAALTSREKALRAQEEHYR